METMKALTTRRTVRAFSPEAIPQETLDEIFSAALMAPSWKNSQTAGYVVVRTPEMLEKIKGALPSFNANTAKDAPIIVVMTTIHGRSGYNTDGTPSTTMDNAWEWFDAGLACQSLMLAAHDHGIAGCIMGIYDEAQIPALLNLPEDQVVTAVIPMGYPAMDPKCPPKKTLEERVSYV